MRSSLFLASVVGVLWKQLCCKWHILAKRSIVESGAAADVGDIWVGAMFQQNSCRLLRLAFYSLHQHCPLFIVTEVQQAFSLQEEGYHCWTAIGTGQVEHSPYWSSFLLNCSLTFSYNISAFLLFSSSCFKVNITSMNFTLHNTNDVFSPQAAELSLPLHFLMP